MQLSQDAPQASRSQQRHFRTGQHWNRCRPISFIVVLLSLLSTRLFIVHCQQSTDATSNATELNDSTTATSNSQYSQLNANPPKVKPVNFTLVDQIFDSTLSDDEVVKKWKLMDLQLQDGMKAILKMLFPQIVSISQDAKVSGDCSGGILKWILSLRNLRSWAIKSK